MRDFVTKFGLLKKHRLEAAIFLGAFILLLSVFLLIFYFHGNSFMFYADSAGYIRLADNLIEHQIFSQSSNFPFLPDSFRTPLYPLFLAGVFLFFNKIFVVGVIQCFFAAVAVVYVFKIGKLLGGNKIGLFSALLFGIDLHHLTVTGAIITEPLFVPLFLISIFYVLYFLKSRKNKHLIITALFLGLASLVKPVAFYLGFVFLLFFIFTYFVIWKKKFNFSFIKTIVIFGLVLFAVILPWLWRNQIVFGEFSLSSIGGYNLYFYNSLSIKAEELGMSKGETASFLKKQVKEKFPGIRDEDMYSFKLSDYYKEQSLQTIKDHKIQYLKTHFLGSSYFLLANYYRRAAYAISGASKTGIPSYDTMQLLKQGKILTEIINLIKKGGFEVVVMILGFAIAGVYLFFLLLNLFYLFRAKNLEYEILLYAVIGYFALVTGPVASGGYRYPILPFIIILALLGITRVYNALSKVRAKIGGDIRTLN